ncbi:MAG: HIT family protein [Paludibacteraceae bacterium]|nr:HIT family protein [Paludibacteraceae bacterium]
MYSDPKDCLYCTDNQTQKDLMVEVMHLSVSRLFIFREQTYRGRCLVAYDEHVNDLNELSDDKRNAFMADVTRVTRVMQQIFQPEKINYGAYADTLSHLHFHLVPKYKGGPDFGGTFRMNPKEVYLDEAEYADMADRLRKALQ